MATWYVVNPQSYRLTINAVEVQRETEKCVFTQRTDWQNNPIPGKIDKHVKVSDWERYFPSFDEAKSFLMNHIDAQIRDLQSKIDSLKDKKQRLNNLNNLTTKTTTP